MSSALLDLSDCETKDVASCSSADSKPIPESCDSADECSYAYLVHVYDIVELEHQLLNRNVFDDEYTTPAGISV